MNLRILLICLICTMLPALSKAQKPDEKSSTEIFEAIKKLNFLGSVLYVAAHPDDENTRLISYLSNHLKANTAYLSLTRGDGGQNRIGSEIREELGLIRTHELLEARKIDGGKQYFSRANDFGYSKHPDETFNIWDKDDVLADMIWVMRKFRPDIIINRFDHRTPGRSHGHHTGSAMLSFDAFNMTDDPTVFPEQLQYTDTWQARRLFFNTSWWFYGSREAFAKADKSKMVSVDVGVYYPLRGKSNTEIAAESRTMHKSQAFGTTGTRGAREEYLELLKGDMPSNSNDLFEGINTSWTRVKGGEKIGQLVSDLEANFDFENPAASLPVLIDIRKYIGKLKDEYWKELKLKETESIIEACLGLYLEAIASDFTAVPGDLVNISVEAINRSEAEVQLEKISWGQSFEIDSIFQIPLSTNEGEKIELSYQIPSNQDFSNPYWLQNEGTTGMYNVPQQNLIGLPRLDKTFRLLFEIAIGGEKFQFYKDLVYRKNDAVKGAVYKPFEVIPAISVELGQDVYIFPDKGPRPVKVKLTAGAKNIEGALKLKLPEDWESVPEELAFQISEKAEVLELAFELHPPDSPTTTEIYPEVIVAEQIYDSKVSTIDYDHIPILTLTNKASAKLVKMDLKKAGTRILYVEGSGDAIPECLEQVGYTVHVIEASEISSQLLETYDACILGIRAYNLHEALRFKQKILLDYVESGGTLVVQYNTTRGLKVDQFGPYPLNLSRDRVAVEEAEVRILAQDHLAMNFPNKISQDDFNGWVQERGIYFCNEWDDKYTAILSSNDPGEPPREGGLLIAEYGQGYFVYTGYSWFRQLPSGVPGAYRIFTNLISLGNTNKP